MTAVLVAGDANLDLVLRGDVRPRFGQAEQLLRSADLVLGSSAGIVAAGLARLDVPVALAARVGDDVFGGHVRRLLHEAGVGTDPVRASDAPTGVSVILSDESDRAILTLAGAMAQLTVDDVLSALTETGARHLHVASVFLLPLLREGLADLLAAAHASGVTTSLDTNWDPEERWEGIASGLPFVDVLLPNAAEATALARALGEDPAGAREAAAALARRGPVVAVKDGAAGAFAVVDGDLVHAPGLTVDVVDTTGAGDSFDAGFLATWLAGGSVRACLRAGAVAGSLSTRAPGGTGSQATRDEIEAADRR